jgi:hypothetical protein
MKKLPIENKEEISFSFEVTPIGCGFVDKPVGKHLSLINKLLAKSDCWNNLRSLDKLIFGLRSWLSCLEKRKSEMLRRKYKK